MLSETKKRIPLDTESTCKCINAQPRRLIAPSKRHWQGRGDSRHHRFPRSRPWSPPASDCAPDVATDGTRLGRQFDATCPTCRGARVCLQVCSELLQSSDRTLDLGLQRVRSSALPCARTVLPLQRCGDRRIDEESLIQSLTPRTSVFSSQSYHRFRRHTARN
jgi:hypothetical protein